MEITPDEIILSEEDQDDIRWPFHVVQRDSADELLYHIEDEFGATTTVLLLRDMDAIDGFNVEPEVVQALLDLESESILRRRENMQDMMVRIGELIAPDVAEELMGSTRP